MRPLLASVMIVMDGCRGLPRLVSGQRRPANTAVEMCGFDAVSGFENIVRLVFFASACMFVYESKKWAKYVMMGNFEWKREVLNTGFMLGR
ncbi:hypothetical protein U9M48_009720 [Paspalum notatum var. saurae]|uniref:Uncharacterized protein n=1 Tax=Paspalum notatum var. saurae TaxID=547442 RepID=A0AAQ3SRQ6_PASNO